MSPDLIRRDTVSEAIKAFLESEPERWGGLQDQLDLAGRHEKASGQFRELFGTIAAEGLDGYLEGVQGRQTRTGQLPDKDKAVILEAYMERCYREWD